MADTFNKKEREKKRDKKKKDKMVKKEARKDNAGGNWESMIMYVDANGQLTSTPPDGSEVAEISAEDIDINIPKRTDEPVDKTLTGRINYFDDKKDTDLSRPVTTKASFSTKTMWVETR